jgi:hypothetical protein
MSAACGILRVCQKALVWRVISGLGDLVAEDFVDEIDINDANKVNAVTKVISVISVNTVIMPLAGKFGSQLPGKRLGRAVLPGGWISQMLHRAGLVSLAFAAAWKDGVPQAKAPR